MCHPHSIFPCWVGFVFDHFYLIAAVLVAVIVTVVTLLVRFVRRRNASTSLKAATPIPAHTRANKLLPWAIAICVGLAVWGLWPDDANGALPPIGPAPAPHPTCGEAPLMILNEDTGELFPAVSVTYEFTGGDHVLRFRDARLFCNGYEGATP